MRKSRQVDGFTSSNHVLRTRTIQRLENVIIASFFRLFSSVLLIIIIIVINTIIIIHNINDINNNYNSNNKNNDDYYRVRQNASVFLWHKGRNFRTITGDCKLAAPINFIRGILAWKPDSFRLDFVSISDERGFVINLHKTISK